jgi:hypothetical protein
MNVTTFGLSFGAQYPLGSIVTLFASAGVQYQSFERNLYLDEQWTKRRAADAGIDSGKVVAYRYGFQNYATTISGNVYSGMVKTGCDVAISELIAFRFSGQYTAYLDQPEKESSRNFPIQGSLILGAGIVVRY